MEAGGLSTHTSAGRRASETEKDQVPPVDTRLRHNAFVYSSVDEYVDVSASFLRAGLELGEGAVVANTRDGLAVMREALGELSSAVRFVDVGEAYTRPARTLAAYHRVYADELARAGSLRAVADVQFGPDPGEWDLWTGYEAVFTRSFEHLPAWVLCSYDASGIPGPVLDGVWRTHPEVLSEGAWNESGTYDADHRPELQAAGRGPLEGAQDLAGADDVERWREQLVRRMHEHGLPDSKVLDLVLAANEVLDNAVTHGGGIKVVRTGRAAGRFACEVVDHGTGFDDPTAGYLAPRSGRGRGLWVVRQLTWELDFVHTPAGFAARITA